MYDQLEEWLIAEIGWAAPEKNYLKIKKILAALQFQDDLFSILRYLCENKKDEKIPSPTSDESG